MRYRRKSLKTLLGITAAKHRLKKATGLTALEHPFNAPKNANRRIKRKLGYYSEPMKFLRFILRLLK